jgi:hypothetical protein
MSEMAVIGRGTEGGIYKNNYEAYLGLELLTVPAKGKNPLVKWRGATVDDCHRWARFQGRSSIHHE